MHMFGSSSMVSMYHMRWVGIWCMPLMLLPTNCTSKLCSPLHPLLPTNCTSKLSDATAPHQLYLQAMLPTAPTAPSKLSDATWGTPRCVWSVYLCMHAWLRVCIHSCTCSLCVYMYDIHKTSMPTKFSCLFIPRACDFRKSCMHSSFIFACFHVHYLLNICPYLHTCVRTVYRHWCIFKYTHTQRQYVSSQIHTNICTGTGTDIRHAYTENMRSWDLLCPLLHLSSSLYRSGSK